MAPGLRFFHGWIITRNAWIRQPVFLTTKPEKKKSLLILVTFQWRWQPPPLLPRGWVNLWALRRNQARLNAEPLFVNETKVWFSRRGHSRMEKKGRGRQVNRMFLSCHKSAILTRWPHRLWWGSGVRVGEVRGGAPLYSSQSSVLSKKCTFFLFKNILDPLPPRGSVLAEQDTYPALCSCGFYLPFTNFVMRQRHNNKKNTQQKHFTRFQLHHDN